MFIFADKTNNLYEMKPEDHEKLITENITKTYQKAPEKLEKAINMEAKNIAKKIKTSRKNRPSTKNRIFHNLKRPQG